MKLNASRLESYRSVRDEIQSFTQANRNWNASGSQEPTPMELDALQKGRKGGKDKGKGKDGKGKGKGKDQKGKNNNNN
eukprot:8967929-Alexandrium_andersonii.AAC.1